MRKSKLLAAALAVALCAPQAAFAARDGEGMEYTSASEGFYGSIRTRYSSNSGTKNNGGKIDADGSRLGVRGSLDLGSGLSGLYRYEWSIHGDNGTPVGDTRLSYVGLRGSFGEFVAGSHWENDYNWVTAATDIASTGSGNFAPHFRRKNSFQYTTPDVNGFQASFRFGMDGGAKEDSEMETLPGTARFVTDDDGDVTELALEGLGGAGANVTLTMALPTMMSTVTIPASIIANPTALTLMTDSVLTLGITGPKKGSETVDEWALAAKYSTHGFTFGAAYEVAPDQRGYQLPAGVLNALGGTNQQALDFISSVTVTPGETTSVGTLTPVDEDHTFWALRFGYGQDNWGVNTWYGKANTAKRGTPTNVWTKSDKESAAVFNARRDTARNKGYKPDDTTTFSIAGNVDMGKIALVAIYEQQKNLWAQEDNVFLLNLDYKFTSRSKAYFAYIANDRQSDPDKDDEVRIGLRMDF